jgi:hypothetical protein
MLSIAPNYYDCGRPQIHVKSLWNSADLCKNPVACSRSHEKKNGFYVFTCLFCGGATVIKFLCGSGQYVRRFLHLEQDVVKNCSF